jgi:hypothetical protein
MKKYGIYSLVAILLIVGLAFGLYACKDKEVVVSRSPSVVTWDGILPGIASELGGTYGINIAMIQSTVGLDVSEESALTNTMHEIASFTHTTSGTPATNIGEKIVFTQETAAANNEDVGYIGFSMSDVTAASEDASFVVGNMAAGAAAATKFTVGSTGIVTMVGSASLDNTTAATELNITETNIQLTGALDLEGGNVKINEDSGDYDFAIETDSTDNAFSIDSGSSTLETNGVTVTLNQAGGDLDFIVESDDDADCFNVDAAEDSADFGAFMGWSIVDINAQSYSISATTPGVVFTDSYTDTGASWIHLMSNLVYTGRVLVIKDKDLNANSNNIVITTEGAETIDEAATLTLDADGESVMLICDGTNWLVLPAYGE